MWKQRYYDAHLANFRVQYPAAYKDELYSKPDLPKVATANGLTTAICNYINWSGYVATRVNTMGRQVNVGIGFEKKKWIKGTTSKGTADIKATIEGVPVDIEIKVGKDRPSPDQLKMQKRVRKSGGRYEFISDMEAFYVLYDSIVNKPTQSKLFVQV